MKYARDDYYFPRTFPLADLFVRIFIFIVIFEPCVCTPYKDEYEWTYLNKSTFNKKSNKYKYKKKNKNKNKEESKANKI